MTPSDRDQMTMQVQCHVRWIVTRDLPEVLAIDQEWTEFDFRESLRQRNCIGMVAESGNQVVGYVLYVLKKNELCIIRLKVHSCWKRTGIGSAIINKLKLKLSQFRRQLMIAVIEDAQGELNDFLRHHKFKAVFMGRSGLIRMQYKLQEQDDEVSNPQP